MDESWKSENAGQLNNWWKSHTRGRCFDSSGGYRLSDGSTHSPDASYLSEERLRQLPKDGLPGFPHVCPDFVIELLSESDTLAALQSKMADWMATGAQPGWLIDPYDRQVFIYRNTAPPERFIGDQVVGEGPCRDSSSTLLTSGIAIRNDVPRTDSDFRHHRLSGRSVFFSRF